MRLVTSSCEPSVATALTRSAIISDTSARLCAPGKLRKPCNALGRSGVPLLGFCSVMLRPSMWAVTRFTRSTTTTETSTRLHGYEPRQASPTNGSPDNSSGLFSCWSEHAVRPTTARPTSTVRSIICSSRSLAARSQGDTHAPVPEVQGLGVRLAASVRSGAMPNRSPRPGLRGQHERVAPC